MQIIRGTLDSPLCVTDTLALHGTVAGPVRVMPSAVFVLRGLCKGNVVVAAGAKAEIWGVVEGDVINQGGDILLGGLVEGYVDRAAGHTDLAPGSRIMRDFR
jgi:hypothetical protein